MLWCKCDESKSELIHQWQMMLISCVKWEILKGSKYAGKCCDEVWNSNIWKRVFILVFLTVTLSIRALLGRINLKMNHKLSTDFSLFLFYLRLSSSVPLFYSSHTPIQTHPLLLCLYHTSLHCSLSPSHTDTYTWGLTGDGIYHTAPFSQSVDRSVLSDKPLTVIYLSFTMPLWSHQS